MVSASRTQTLLTSAKAQERHLYQRDFSRLVTRLVKIIPCTSVYFINYIVLELLCNGWLVHSGTRQKVGLVCIGKKVHCGPVSAAIHFIMHIGSCRVTSCFSRDLQKAFQRVTTCNNRCQQGNNKLRCNVFAIRMSGLISR